MSLPAPHHQALLQNAALEKSDVVANSRMNRERGLAGVNSYEKELSCDLLSLIESRLKDSPSFAWLDLCCGRGKALIEAAERLVDFSDRVCLHGVDLVNMFQMIPSALSQVRFEAASLHEWSPTRQYDLITCVHGLHYIGDKLGLLERAATWLAPDGLLMANLDLANLRREDGRVLGPLLLAALHANGFAYHRRRRVLSRRGNNPCTFRLRYLGADDRAGPNCTGQEAVHSLYVLEDMSRST